MTHIELSECASSLRKIRAQLPSNLDPGVLVELEEIIHRLEHADETNDVAEAVEQAVLFLGRLVEVTVGVVQLVNLFRN